MEGHIGDNVAGERHAQIGLEMCRDLGNERSAAMALWNLAGFAYIRGDDDLAESRLKESLESLLSIEGATEISWVYSVLSIVTLRQGRPAEARQYLVEALHTASGVFGLVAVQFCLAARMRLFAEEGRPEQALALGALLDSHPISRSIVFRSLYADCLAELKASLPQDVVAKAEARGRARDFQETVAEIAADLEEGVAQ